MERNIKVLFPPPQPGPSEKISIIHQLRDVKRLIMKDDIIVELPYWPCSCCPPYFPSFIGNLRGCYGGVLEEIIHGPTMKNSVLPNPAVEFPPQRHNFW